MFTRRRPQKKNDQVHVGEKDRQRSPEGLGATASQETEATAAQQAVYDDYRVYVKFLQPIRKLDQQRARAARGEDAATAPTTAYRRVLA